MSVTHSEQGQQDFGERDVSLRFTFPNFFVQDEFRLSRRLTLSFGLRYEAVLFPELDPQVPYELSRKVNNDRPLFRARNDVKGPDYWQADFRLARRFKFRDRYGIELIAEAENLANRFNANCSIAGCTGAVVNVATAADFGRITSVRPPRRFQFGRRFSF